MIDGYLIKKEHLFVKGYPNKYNIFNPYIQSDEAERGNNSVGMNGIIVGSREKRNQIIYKEYRNINYKVNKAGENPSNILISKSRNIKRKCLKHSQIYMNKLKYPYQYNYITKLNKNIYSYIDTSFIITAIPDILSAHNIYLIKSQTYTKEHSFYLAHKSTIYLCIGISLYNMEKYANTLIRENGWKYVEGTQNIITMITADISNDCFLSNICNGKNLYEDIETLNMLIFYKEGISGDVEIKYPFFDFDDLNAVLHLL